MVEKNFIHKIGELEEAVGILQDTRIDAQVTLLVNISCWWYGISGDAGLVLKIREIMARELPY